MQQTEFDTVISIDASSATDPIKLQTYKHYMLQICKKVITERTTLTPLAVVLGQIKIAQLYIPPTTVTQSSFVTILKELAKEATT